MLGLSLGKLLLLALVLLALWYGVKFLTRVGEVRQAVRRAADQANVNSPRGRRAKTIATEDLVKCRACGAFVSQNATSCGRNDCPWGR